MILVDFAKLHDLKPVAFKLYVCMLDLAERTKTRDITMPLVDLGHESGLQPERKYRPERHGLDGQVRRALRELIEQGYIEKTETGRGRQSNTYHIMDRC